MKKFPLDELIRIVKNDPNGTNKAWCETFWTECAPMFTREFFMYWFENHVNRVVIEQTPKGQVVKAMPVRGAIRIIRKPRKPDPDAKAARDKAIKKLADKVSAMVLMDLRTSTGKKLRDCTFGELAKEAGWLGAIAKRGKPGDRVGDVLTEADLFNVRMRNDG